MYLCKSGTFIGIDSYIPQAPAKAIYSAASDARRLEHYFSAASPKGAWNALTSTEQEPVTRLDVVQAIHRWIRSIQRGDAGLLYFAGHGLLTEEGLVLAASDFVGRIAVDSGLKLSRVAELISKHGHRESRYVILLDCCREADDEFSFEAITPNIAILYACAPGEPALEIGDGGAYASAIISWLESGDATEIDGSYYSSLDGAAETMKRLIAERLGHAIQVPEQFGANPREILIPKIPVTPISFVYDKGSAPRICIRSTQIAPDHIAATLEFVRLLKWTPEIGPNVKV